jgi:hypothetical protein
MIETTRLRSTKTKIFRFSDAEVKQYHQTGFVLMPLRQGTKIRIPTDIELMVNDVGSPYDFTGAPAAHIRLSGGPTQHDLDTIGWSSLPGQLIGSQALLLSGQTWTVADLSGVLSLQPDPNSTAVTGGGPNANVTVVVHYWEF